jgi:hypothetical protein
MGLKIVIPIEYQRVKKISLMAMPLRGETPTPIAVNLRVEL